jgi:hypothetical protein
MLQSTNTSIEIWFKRGDRHSVSLRMYFTYNPIPNYCRPCAQYITSVLQ